MNLDCPHCGSGNTQLLSMAYSSGLTHSTAVTHTREAFGVADTHVHRTTTVDQSELSRATAPPSKEPIGSVLGGGVVLTLIFGLIGGFLGTGPLGVAVTLFGALAIPLCGYAAYRNFMYNLRQWPGEMAAWQQGYICFRCGTVYWPTDEAERLVGGETFDVPRVAQR